MMECRSVRQRLSAYLEGIIPSEEKKVIEEHLLSCQPCSMALGDLKREGELLRSLEEVEPPAWMKQKVLARIRREQEAKKSIFGKLFLPLRIKIPIQAAATVLIALLAVYVFKAGGPEMKMAPSPRVTGEVTSKDEMLKQSSAPAPEVQPPGAAAVTKEMPKPVEGREVSRPVEEKQKGPMARSDREKAREAAPLPEAPGPGRREEVRSRQGESGKSFGAEEQSASSEGASPTPPLPLRAAAIKKAEVVTITIQVKDVRIAVGEIEDLLGQFGAIGLEREPIQDGEAITTEVSSEKINELTKKLNLKGKIQQKELPARFPKGKTRIRVEIVSSR
jgi:hypothetical protein